MKRPFVAPFLVLAACGPLLAQRPSAPARGRVMTVLGPIDPDSVGLTLMHEHLASNMLAPDAGTGYHGRGPLPPRFSRAFQESGRYFRIPRTAEQLAFWNEPNLTGAMLDRLAAGWMTKSMFVLDDAGATRAELAAFRRAGGRTVVDVTTVGIGRDPARLRDFARQSGVQVVMGTGWYRWMFHPPAVARRSVDQLAAIMVRELTKGVGTTGIRAGIIGEIPIDAAGLRLPGPVDSLYPDSAIVARRDAVQARIRAGEPPEAVYDPAEIKVLRAAARASRRTGAAITLHAPDPWIAYLDILEREGADLRRVVIGHADRVLLDEDLARRAFARGVYLQLDYTLQRYGGRDVGPFDQLIDRIVWAVRAGFGDQVLLSLDLCFRQGLAKYGGGGYATLAERVIPALARRGLTDAEIGRIVRDNPRRALTIAADR